MRKWDTARRPVTFRDGIPAGPVHSMADWWLIGFPPLYGRRRFGCHTSLPYGRAPACSRRQNRRRTPTYRPTWREAATERGIGNLGQTLEYGARRALANNGQQINRYGRPRLERACAREPSISAGRRAIIEGPSRRRPHSSPPVTHRWSVGQAVILCIAALGVNVRFCRVRCAVEGRNGRFRVTVCRLRRQAPARALARTGP
jgi:hypothetical protein